MTSNFFRAALVAGAAVAALSVAACSKPADKTDATAAAPADATAAPAAPAADATAAAPAAAPAGAMTSGRRSGRRRFGRSGRRDGRRRGQLGLQRRQGGQQRRQERRGRRQEAVSFNGRARPALSRRAVPDRERPFFCDPRRPIETGETRLRRIGADIGVIRRGLLLRRRRPRRVARGLPVRLWPAGAVARARAVRRRRTWVRDRP